MTRIGVVVSALLLFAVASVAAEEQYTTSDFSTTSDVSRMEFQTCSGWRLNKHPELKQFFKETVDKGLIDGVRVRYIPGNAPELVMFDLTGQEKERINLEKMTVTEIRGMLASHGFAERASRVEL